jgi:hypothetical protein
MSRQLPLILTYGALSVRIFKFSDNEDQKKMVSFEEFGEVRYSLNGAPIDTGIQYEPHRIWTFEAAHLTKAERNTIELIAKMQNDARRRWTTTQNYAVRLHDWITPYIDVGTTRTRAIAMDGTTAGVAISIGSSGLSYPAQWDVRFLSMPEFSNVRTNSTIYNCQITLKELNRVLP